MTRRGRAARPAATAARAGDAASALHQRALTAARQGQLDPAIALFRQALEANPRFAAAHNDLGVALEATGRLDAAMTHYHDALALEPALASAHHNLGRALQAHGRPDEAVAQYRQAIEAAPKFVEAHLNLGVVLVTLGRLDEATACFRQALAIQPGNADANNNLGSMLARLQRWEEAIACFEQAIAANPRHADAHGNLGNALVALGRHAEAIAWYETALALAPDNAKTCTGMADALLALRREPEALACYQRAIAIDPRRAEAYRNMSAALLSVGRLDEARGAIERAVALAPEQLEFYVVLAECRRFTPDDPQLATMAALARNLGQYSEKDQMSLHFALAKAYEDVGEHARSFEHLLLANAIKRRDTVYDEAAAIGRLDRVRTIVTEALIRRQSGHGAASPVPVFIIGMLRSGTTLVEQILASHREIFGAGEIEDFRTLAEDLRGPGGTKLAFPEVMASMSGAQLRELGENYLARLRAAAPAAARITDKQPLNFIFAGLIHLALPQARLIHVRRHPVDTCLSCFSKEFVGDQPYSYDLGELGRFYRAYEAVMAHWRRVLPPGIMLEVRYEDVIDDLEREARRLVAHCGLAWDDACLAFHTAQRPVRTASVSQVRQPIYRSSVARWKPYARLLTPLLEALGERAGESS